MKMLFVIAALLFVVKGSGNPSPIGEGQMPAAALDKNGNIHLVYGKGDSLLYVISNDKGKTFSKPHLIKVIDGLAASATRGPQIAIVMNAPVVLASTEAGNIWAFRKNIRGGWDGQSKLNDVDSVNLEGFVDVASDGNLKLFAAWLDLRGNKRNKIYGAMSSDGGKTWSRNIKVYESPDSTICECCRISVAMQHDEVFIMFRNQLYGYRDLHVITSTNAGRTFAKPEKLGNGTWKLNGCPMDGGALAIDSGGKLQTAWRRESKIYSCEPGHAEVEIGEGKACTIENVNGKNAFAWVKNGEIVCRLPDGTIKILGTGVGPSLLAIAHNVLMCTWENENHIYYSILQI
jgi:hypothetical protein